MQDLTPQQIVNELDKYIIGQEKAKKSVAVALRNRYRRSMLPEELQEEITPKNIIMIGPTGVGKTEIARRLARLVQAPFIKVEATKYTEVGYVGRDVESMIRDLTETAVRMVSREKEEGVMDKATEQAEKRLLNFLSPLPSNKKPSFDPLSVFLGQKPAQEEKKDISFEENEKAREKREIVKQKLSRFELEDEYIEVELEEKKPSMMDAFSGMGIDNVGINFDEIFNGIMPNKTKKRRMKVKQAREALQQEEAGKLIDQEEVKQEAIKRVENRGIVFLDEIDKIASGGKTQGADVSREGVQRDILPIVEGSIVSTKYGNVRTDHILFIAAGAFHTSKPADLIPELQGRFPIRVELDELKKTDFIRILQEPDNALIKQYGYLLETEGVKLRFNREAIEEIADVAYTVNSQLENIGARRLHTILEKLLEDIMFDTTESQKEDILIDKAFVEERLSDISREKDLSRYIL